MNEREEEIGKILEPHQLSPGLMRHACIAAVGYLTGISIQSKDQMIATLREAVTTPCAGWETFQSLREELAALRQQLAEARAEVERLVEERERTINELHDAADELSCPHVHGIETVDGKAEAVWLGAMVAKQLRVNAERNGVERGEVAKLLEDNWRLYKQQLAAQAAELERLGDHNTDLINQTIDLHREIDGIRLVLDAARAVVAEVNQSGTSGYHSKLYKAMVNALEDVK